MMADTERMISVTEFARDASKIVASAEAGGDPVVILKRNRPAAVLVSIEDAERMARMRDQLEDLELATLALVRMATDDGTRHALDDVLAEYGVEVDDDSDEPDVD